MFEWFEFPFMVQALVACSVMGIVLAYFGIHVIGRGIVFVDLALGQISSLGVAYAAYSGRDPLLWSMIFTLIGAVLFSGLRVRDVRLRLEAIIGIFYAGSSAVTVLLIAKTPHGEADIQDVLFGNVLAIDSSELRLMLWVFGVVAFLNVLLRKRFFALTYRKGAGEELALQDHAMNLLFYLLLALAIVFAIRAGGVIPVFAYLIIPPVAAVFLARGTGAVVALTLGVAVVSSFVGLHLSFAYDLPAGPSIVGVLALVAVLAVAVGKLLRLIGRHRRRKATALVLLGLLALAPSRAAAARDGVPRPSDELAELRAIVLQASERIEALEAELEELAKSQGEPAPPAPAATGLRLIDISLGGLFSAGASSARESELRILEFGAHDPKNRGFTVQNLELAMSGAVDPYLRGDAFLIFQIDEEGESFVELEEAFFTTLSLPAGLQVKAGTFFSPFGRLNPQHPHSWDFIDQPVVNSRLLGPDGLRGPGMQLNWLLPTPFFAEFTLDVQNSQGETAFSFRSEPGEEFAGRELLERDVRTARDLLFLGRLSSSFDLTDSFTVLTGLSHVTGPNATGPDARTDITGIDFYGKWKPLRNQRGWPFFAVQAEAMMRDYQAAAQVTEDGTLLPAEVLRDWGTYLQGTWGFKPRWVAGLRVDWADGNGDNKTDPLRDRRLRISPNASFYPTEFSKFRLQYNWDRADHLERDQSSLFLQFEFRYGAHGGHKF